MEKSTKHCSLLRAETKLGNLPSKWGRWKELKCWHHGLGQTLLATQCRPQSLDSPKGLPSP